MRSTQNHSFKCVLNPKLLVSLGLILIVGMGEHARAIGRADVDTVQKLKVGGLADFDGDEIADTLFLRAQEFKIKDRVVLTRWMPAFIAWKSKGETKLLDTTYLDIDADSSATIGMRLLDVDKDGITDIELAYRWVGKVDKSTNRAEENIWLIAGGDKLRQQGTLNVSDARKPTEQSRSVLTDITNNSRDQVQAIGLGGRGIRRIRNRLQLLKSPVHVSPRPDSAISIRVYPIPASEWVEIEWNPLDNVASLEISDVNGTLISKIRQNIKSPLKVDLRSIPSGTYSVMLTGCYRCPISSTIVVRR